MFVIAYPPCTHGYKPFELVGGHLMIDLSEFHSTYSSLMLHIRGWSWDPKTVGGTCPRPVGHGLQNGFVDDEWWPAKIGWILLHLNSKHNQRSGLLMKLVPIDAWTWSCATVRPAANCRLAGWTSGLLCLELRWTTPGCVNSFLDFKVRSPGTWKNMAG